MVMLEISNFLHFIGLAWGVGGATVAVIISSKAEKNLEMSPAVMKIMPSISKVIMAGLILLIISGILLPFFVKWPLNTKNLIIKHVLVAWILIIGIVLGVKSKKMGRLAPIGKGKPSPIFFKIKKQVKGLSIINLILWYLVTLLSVFV